MRLTFPKSRHIRSPREFEAVYAARVRISRGPFTVYALVNGLGHPRVGFSISRKVGNAVRRNRIRRLLREAFRAVQHELPGDYDLVIVCRAHEALLLDEYKSALQAAVEKLHATWQAKSATTDLS